VVIKIQSRLKLGIRGSSQEAFLFVVFERGNHLSVFTLQESNKRKRKRSLEKFFSFLFFFLYAMLLAFAQLYIICHRS